MKGLDKYRHNDGLYHQDGVFSINTNPKENASVTYNFILNQTHTGVRHHPGHGRFPTITLPNILLHLVMLYLIYYN